MLNLYYKIHDLYYLLKERIGRSIAFAKIAWLNYDFDASTMYQLMAFKLRRVHKTLLNGYAIQEPAHMAALLEAVDVCDRLYKDAYENNYYEEHFKKWGVPKTTTIPIEGAECYRLDFYIEGVDTEEQKAQEREELFECTTKAEEDRRKDLDRLNVLLKEHAPHWWD